MSAFDPLQTLALCPKLSLDAEGREVEFRASSESDVASYEALESVRRAVEPVLQNLLSGSEFATTELLIRYVPIVMPPELLDRYPSRSKARLKQRILDCAPQLDYETFVRGSYIDQVQAYVGGIRTAVTLLPKFGLTPAEGR